MGVPSGSSDGVSALPASTKSALHNTAIKELRKDRTCVELYQYMAHLKLRSSVLSLSRVPPKGISHNELHKEYLAISRTSPRGASRQDETGAGGRWSSHQAASARSVGLLLLGKDVVHLGPVVALLHRVLHEVLQQHHCVVRGVAQAQLLRVLCGCRLDLVVGETLADRICEALRGLLQKAVFHADAKTLALNCVRGRELVVEERRDDRGAA
eukprot:2229839-Pleurochrysis_carterae.AAC.3